MCLLGSIALAGSPTEGVGCVAQFPTCAEPDPEVGPLVDYGALEVGQRYYVNVVQDPQWMPIPRPKMPYHHASALVWTNLESHPGLEVPVCGPLRFTFVLEGREVVYAGPERGWRATYTARIESVCLPR